MKKEDEEKLKKEALKKMQEKEKSIRDNKEIKK
jgi:hypothetical protein